MCKWNVRYKSLYLGSSQFDPSQLVWEIRREVVNELTIALALEPLFLRMTRSLPCSHHASKEKQKGIHCTHSHERHSIDWFDTIDLIMVIQKENLSNKTLQ